MDQPGKLHWRWKTNVNFSQHSIFTMYTRNNLTNYVCSSVTQMIFFSSLRWCIFFSFVSSECLRFNFTVILAGSRTKEYNKFDLIITGVQCVFLFFTLFSSNVWMNVITFEIVFVLYEYVFLFLYHFTVEWKKEIAL